MLMPADRSPASRRVPQLIIPPELGYPLDDPKHDRVGPKPSTFSGQRALDFVLQNPVRIP